MVHHYNYSLTELENMIPWEREVYTHYIIEHIKNEKEQLNRN
jgi:hypothetical protein